MAPHQGRTCKPLVSVPYCRYDYVASCSLTTARCIEGAWFVVHVDGNCPAGGDGG